MVRDKKNVRNCTDHQPLKMYRTILQHHCLIISSHSFTTAAFRAALKLSLFSLYGCMNIHWGKKISTAEQKRR